MNCQLVGSERLFMRMMMKKPVNVSNSLLRANRINLSRSLSLGRGSFSPIINTFAFQNFVKPGLFTIAGIGATYTFFIMKQELSFERAINKYPEYFQKVLRYFNGNWNLAWNSYLEARGTDANDILYPLKKAWYSLSDYNRTMIPLIGLNILIYLMWKIPRFHPMLSKYFICRPTTSHYTSIFFSAFSHIDGWHIAANMFCFYSLGRSLFDQYGTDHFLAFYISSCFVSGYLSYLMKFFRGSVGIGSLGASGAVFSVMASLIMLQPNIRLSLIFLPFFSFSGATGLIGAFIFEIFCLFFFNMGFDNAAHLSGMIYGSCYNKFISPVLWTRYRHYLVSKYRSLVGFDYNLTKRIEKKKFK